MRKKSNASGCSVFMRRYCCMAGVWGMLVVLMDAGLESRAREYMLTTGYRTPMHLLALDTTSRYGSVALLSGGELRGEVRLVEAGAYSRTLFPAIESLLRLAGIRPGDVDAYAAAVGPGSFT